MNLSITVRQLEHIVILELSGRLSVLEANLCQLADQLIERGHRHFIINLANVSYLDNSGLGQLCWIYTAARKDGGEVLLIKPTRRIKWLLNITKLDTVFECFEREGDAIASMTGVKAAVSA